jgi:hypothetical protein
MKYNTLRFTFLTLLFGFFLLGQAQQAGDTIVVQTFSYSDPAPASVYTGTYQFPAATEEFQKIIMSYSLKCDPSTRRDRFDCGEWDYLTYTFLTDSSGLYDSTFRSQQSYRYMNGSSPDSVPFSLSPTYTYYQEWQKYINYGQTLNLDSAKLAAATHTTTEPLQANRLQGRARYLWRASELSTNGLSAGDITGMRINVSALGTDLKNLSIRFKHTGLDSLSLDTVAQTGFSQVYRLTTSIGQQGWYTFAFPQAFNWDGTSNLIAEFLYEGDPQSGQAHTLENGQTAFPSGLVAAGDNHYLDFDGSRDYINVGSDIQAQINGAQERTIEAWVYTRSFNGGGVFQAGSTGAGSRDFSLRTLSFDRWRIQLWGPDYDVTLPGSNNSWHHYAVVYDGTTARLYYDGQEVVSGPASLNTGNTSFRIGVWNGREFNGNIDEVRVWNKALDAQTIQDWMNQSIDNAHPDYSNLVGYYPIDEGDGFSAADISGNGYDGQLIGMPAWAKYTPEETTFGLQPSWDRPDVVFEQRSHSGSVVDSVLAIDSVQQGADQLIVFENPGGNFIIRHDEPNQPSTPTDTVLGWPANQYTYYFDRNTGAKVDSVYLSADTTRYRQLTTWYNNIVRYELARYITPYGINLDLGPNGTTWYFDVTDYAPLLHDHVYLRAGNNQELLDLKFIMIKGEAPRDVKRIQNIHDGSWSFASFVNQTNATPQTKILDPNASMYRVKTRTTGHGFGGSGGTNCSEFCRRRHSVWVNGNKEYEWWLWNECAFNQVQPQGGTWIFDRAGWCPGDAVKTYNHEITDLVSPGDTVLLDYEVDAAGQPAEGNWVLRTQLVSYGDINHQLDVAIEDVTAPTSNDVHGHYNPICDNPKVIIKNRGATPITSVIITYGVVNGFKPCYHRWNGNLEFGEEEEVELPLFNWTGAHNSANPRFFATVSYPNYVQDGYDRNNHIEVPFALPPQYPNKFVVKLSTNRRASENRWYVIDDAGTVVYQRAFLSNLTAYEDTLALPDGCYTLILEDLAQDGLDFFFNRAQAGSGSFRFEDVNGNVIRPFDPDFGGEIRHQFTIGYTLGQEFNDVPCENITGIEDEEDISPLGIMKLYPNPAHDQFSLQLKLIDRSDAEVAIYNLMGDELERRKITSALDQKIDFDAPYPAGLYFVTLTTAKGRMTKVLVLK